MPFCCNRNESVTSGGEYRFLVFPAFSVWYFGLHRIKFKIFNLIDMWSDLHTHAVISYTSSAWQLALFFTNMRYDRYVSLAEEPPIWWKAREIKCAVYKKSERSLIIWHLWLGFGHYLSRNLTSQPQDFIFILEFIAIAINFCNITMLTLKSVLLLISR